MGQGTALLESRGFSFGGHSKLGSTHGPIVSMDPRRMLPDSYFFKSLGTILAEGLWLMSSTLKKRRAKMNKHKLRKRRKLERRKNK